MPSKPKLILCNGKKYLVKDPSKDYHFQFGFLKAAKLKNAKEGEVLQTNMGRACTVFTACFLDQYRKIKRGAQIIPLKDIGLIITNTGIEKNSIIVDAGAGSGGLCCFLANIAKKVVSYEIRDDFAKIVEENKKLLNLKNLTIIKHDVTKGIKEKNVDVVIFDLPSPWDGLDAAYAALRPGGFLVSYSPTIPQVADFVNIAVEKGWHVVKTSEIIEREWEVTGRKVRPMSQQIGHSGFLSFLRKQ